MHSYVCVALKSRKHGSLAKRESLMENTRWYSYVRGNTHPLGYACVWETRYPGKHYVSLWHRLTDHLIMHIYYREFRHYTMYHCLVLNNCLFTSLSSQKHEQKHGPLHFCLGILCSNYLRLFKCMYGIGQKTTMLEQWRSQGRAW